MTQERKTSRTIKRRASHQEATQDGARATETARPELERAEEVLDNLSKRVSEWMHLASLQAMVVYSRAREEVEDIVAEAQVIRQKRRS